MRARYATGIGVFAGRVLYMQYQCLELEENRGMSRHTIFGVTDPNDMQLDELIDCWWRCSSMLDNAPRSAGTYSELSNERKASSNENNM